MSNPRAALLLPAFVAACTNDLGVIASPLLAPEPDATACIDPRAYGAAVDDPLVDSGPAIQAAVDAAQASRKPVCLPPGDLWVAKPTGRIASVILDGAVVVSGAGEHASTIRMKGGAGGDWTVFELTGDANRLTDFAIDGADRENTDEQTHLIQVEGPATDTRIDHVRLSLQRIPTFGGGDCIRLLGNEPVDLPAKLVDGVSIVDVTMPECDRSGIGFQRGVRNVWISGLVTRSVGDQAIDMEPTGTGTIRGVTIRDSLVHTGRGQGIAMTLTGNGGTFETATEGVVVDNVDLDGQIFMYNVGHTQLRNLRIDVANQAAIGAIKTGAGIVVDGGYFRRTGDAGSVLSFTLHSGNFPTEVVVRNAHIVQAADGPPVKFSPTAGALVQGSTIECLGPTPDTYAAIVFEAVGFPSTRLRVIGNSVVGNCKWGVSFPAGGSMTAVANQLEVSLAGARFNGAPAVAPVVDGNIIWKPGATPAAVSPTTQAFVGTNSL
jgi:hypothetical protein